MLQGAACAAHVSAKAECACALCAAQAKSFLCCDGVNMFGNLWVAQFAAVCIAVLLLICIFAYIGKLDVLPPRACASCLMHPLPSCCRMPS